ncbi:hypothetical protein QTH89_23345 [Variovorax sp. J22G21]|nr:hypothetical protein [Variovorax sp. J22G21]MDM0064168.1 hypothetical protein [Variovorax sp. J22G21]
MSQYLVIVIVCLASALALILALPTDAVSSNWEWPATTAAPR